MLIFGIVGGLSDAAAQLAGVPPHWAFAIGWLIGFGVVAGRATVAGQAGTASRRWRVFTIQVSLMTAVTVLVAALWGARIFASAA
jgi:hypothetical protein